MPRVRGGDGVRAFQLVDTARLAEVSQTGGAPAVDGDGYVFDLLLVLKQLLTLLMCFGAFLVALNMIRQPRFLASHALVLGMLIGMAALLSYTIFRARREDDDVLAQAMQEEAAAANGAAAEAVAATEAAAAATEAAATDEAAEEATAGSGGLEPAGGGGPSRRRRPRAAGGARY